MHAAALCPSIFTVGVCMCVSSVRNQVESDRLLIPSQPPGLRPLVYASGHSCSRSTHWCHGWCLIPAVSLAKKLGISGNLGSFFWPHIADIFFGYSFESLFTEIEHFLRTFFLVFQENTFFETLFLVLTKQKPVFFASLGETVQYGSANT